MVAEPLCGTFRTWGPKNRPPLRKRNLAEPFPTHFLATPKYKKVISKSDIGWFRRFRFFLRLGCLYEMCGKRFRKVPHAPLERGNQTHLEVVTQSACGSTSKTALHGYAENV